MSIDEIPERERHFYDGRLLSEQKTNAKEWGAYSSLLSFPPAFIAAWGLEESIQAFFVSGGMVLKDAEHATTLLQVCGTPAVCAVLGLTVGFSAMAYYKAKNFLTK